MNSSDHYRLPTCNIEYQDSDEKHIIELELKTDPQNKDEIKKEGTINGCNLFSSSVDGLPESSKTDLLHIKGTTHTAKSRIYTIDTIEQASIVDEVPLMGHNTSLDEGCDYIQHCRCMPKRYVLTLLSFLGFFNVYCLRVDLSVALVAMTSNHTKIRFDGTEYRAQAEFEWDSVLQGHILSAFYYGYLITQIPGGYIAAHFGGKHLFGGAILLSAILTLMTPMASRHHWSMLFALRFVEGLCEGCIYPAMYSILSRWAPPLERAKMVTIPHSGSYSGSVAGTLVAGYLCEFSDWSWVFYLFGMIALMWVIAWQILVTDSPEDDWHISSDEKRMICESLKEDNTSRLIEGSPPWLHIVTNIPFLAILVAHSCEGWGFNLMQTSLPKFLGEAMNLRLSRAGEYTAILYVVMGLVTFISGQLSDCFRQYKSVSATLIRKVFTTTGFFCCAIAFMLSAYVTSPAAVVTLITIGAGLEAMAWAGFGINHLDIAPRYASLLFGITNTFATISGILSPILVGSMTSCGRREEWTTVFNISAFTFVFGAVFYGLFGSAQKQPWADPILLESSRMKRRTTSN